MAITALRDRFLSPSSEAKQTAVESYHWVQAAASFDRELSMSLKLSDRDAFWATAALLMAIEFFSIETLVCGRKVSTQFLIVFRLRVFKDGGWCFTDFQSYKPYAAGKHLPLSCR